MLPSTRHGFAREPDRLADDGVNGPLYGAKIRAGVDQGA